MKAYSERHENPEFRKRFIKGLLLAFGAALLMACSLFAMGLIAFLGAKYGW